MKEFSSNAPVKCDICGTETHTFYRIDDKIYCERCAPWKGVTRFH